MIVRIAARVTCRRTRAKISGRAKMNKIAPINTSDRIRVLNDNFRSTFIGGRVVMSSGVAALSLEVQAHVFIHVQTFAEFNTDNDPYGEHDFGSFEVGNEKFFWKIDYFDQACEFGSDDAADPTKTTRVLTIMFAGEY
jgi:Protein of unknown function (DUF3768)